MRADVAAWMHRERTSIEGGLWCDIADRLIVEVASRRARIRGPW